MTGKQLKNSILQWAIQGKLVPQDPNDEPASVLLEKIRQEKERLIKEKKIKRDKNASIIFRGEDNSYYEKFLATGEVKCIDEEIPFEIPQGWEWCRLGDVIQLLSGRDLEPYQYNSDGIGIPYMTGASNFCHEELIVNRWTEVPITVSHFGDLLITCKGTIGTMAFNNIGDIHIARQIMGISSSYVSLKYIKLCLEIHVAELQKAARSIIPGISRDDMLYAIIPLPPIKEQERISDRLADVLPFVDKYGDLQCKLDRLNTLINELLKKSILQEAIQGKLVPQIAEEGTARELLGQIRQEKQKLVEEGKLKKTALTDSIIYKGDDNRYYERINKENAEIELSYDYPDSWCVVRLKEVCQLIDGVKMSGKGICLDAKYLRGKSSPAYLDKGKFVRENDSIILVDGENSGEVFTVPVDGYMGSTFKQLWLSTAMYKPYLLAFILFYKEALRNSKRGAAIPHLNKELFYNLPIGIPPYQEQERIAQRINSLFQSIAL